MSTRRQRVPGMSCPVCGARGDIASSQEMSHLTRRVYYRCQDIECGHNWQADLSFVKTISPSAHGPVNQLRRIAERHTDLLTRPLTETRPPPPG